MRILAEEAVEELYYRMSYLGIPLEDEQCAPGPQYWASYIRAVHSGELLDNEYSRFRAAQKLMGIFLDHSYIDDDENDTGEYKVLRYAYAQSEGPMPAWFSAEKVMRYLEEIVTACGFLWFSIVDYAEEQYYAKGA